MEDIDWSKAPEGATHYMPEHRCFVRPSERKGLWFEVNTGCAVASQRGLIERPSPSWNGQGLPPVGAVCELRCLPTGAWGKAEIKYISKTQCVWLWVRDDGGYQVELAEVPDVARMAFRPVRTPEQIAADERKSVIDVACDDIEKQIDKYNTTLSHSLAIKATIKATIEAMIAAGYRKP